MEGLITVVIVLAVAGAIVYALFRPREKGEKRGWDLYYYIVIFISIALLFWAISDLGRVWLEQLWNTGTSYYYQASRSDIFLRRISLRLSTLLVALPIFAFHYTKATLKKDEELDYHSRKTYAMMVLILSSLVVLGCGTGLVYQGMNFALGVSEKPPQALAFFIPYTISGLMVCVMHYRIWQVAEHRVKPAILR